MLRCCLAFCLPVIDISEEHKHPGRVPPTPRVGRRPSSPADCGIGAHQCMPSGKIVPLERPAWGVQLCRLRLSVKCSRRTPLRTQREWLVMLFTACKLQYRQSIDLGSPICDLLQWTSQYQRAYKPPRGMFSLGSLLEGHPRELLGMACLSRGAKACRVMLAPARCIHPAASLD